MWIPTAVFQETPLSIYLKSLRHGSPHDHDWMLVAGSGGPIRCALGRGREIQQASRSNEIVDALKLIRLHRGDTEAHVWTKRLLNPTASASARQALCYLGEGAGDFDVDYTLAVEEFEGSERANPL